MAKIKTFKKKGQNIEVNEAEELVPVNLLTERQEKLDSIEATIADYQARKAVVEAEIAEIEALIN